MSANTRIEWCDATWNPVRGCARVSPGCASCYAMIDAHRFSGPGLPYEGLATLRNGKPDWSGTARVAPNVLGDPLRWRKPCRVFVNSMSDLFHHSITDDELALIFGIMIRAHQHQFLVLTKRPEAMRDFIADCSAERCIDALANSTIAAPRGLEWPKRIVWPPANVGLGVSVENQRFADERLPILLATEAAMRFVSCEPLLESVSLAPFMSPTRGLDWVIVGGESGRGGFEARPFDLDWARLLRGEARAHGVAFFMKQAGDNPLDHGAPVTLTAHKGKNLAELPFELRIREFPAEPWTVD